MFVKGEAGILNVVGFIGQNPYILKVQGSTVCVIAVYP